MILLHDVALSLGTRDCIPVGYIAPARWPYLPAYSAVGVCVSALGGVCCQGGVCSQRGVCSRGVCSWGCLLRGVPGPGGGWYPSMHWGKPPPREQNHTRLWKYNLAPTSLRAVKIRCGGPAGIVQSVERLPWLTLWAKGVFHKGNEQLICYLFVRFGRLSYSQIGSK